MAPVGVAGDANFTGGADSAHYQVAGLVPGSYRVKVALLFQTISAREAAKLFLDDQIARSQRLPAIPRGRRTHARDAGDNGGNDTLSIARGFFPASGGDSPGLSPMCPMQGRDSIGTRVPPAPLDKKDDDGCAAGYGNTGALRVVAFLALAGRRTQPVRAAAWSWSEHFAQVERVR